MGRIQVEPEVVVERVAIGPCPNLHCAVPIWSDHGDSWCHQCGEPFPDFFLAKLPKEDERRAAANAVIRGGETESGLEIASPRVRALASRYKDGYAVANSILGIGGMVKIASWVLALLIAIVGTKAASDVGLGFGAALIAAALFGFGGWLGGVLLSAQGQLLLASLDQAVGASPFLDTEQKATILSLP